MNVILISGRIAENDSYYEIRESLDVEWGRLFSNYENILLVPTLVGIPLENYIALNPRGILISGGNTVNSDKEADALRLKHSLNLIDFGINNAIPILGVCYGTQVINHYFNGTLMKSNRDKHVAKRHPVDFLASDFVEHYSASSSVNSYHDEELDKLGGGLLVAVKDSQNSIEGITHVDKKIAGIMWHPERGDTHNKQDLNFIRSYFNI